MSIQSLVEIDRQLLAFFNGSDSLFLDGLIVTLTSGATWIPLYVALLYLVIKNNDSMAQILLIVGCCMLCFFVTEFVTEGLVKPAVARPRPGNHPLYMYDVDVVNDLRGLDYSFFSAHASNTFGIAVFFCLLVRNRLFSWLMITWSMLNCYTRLYLAKHYPSDIFVGLLFGALVGTMVYLLFATVYKRISSRSTYISSQYSRTGYSLDDIDVVACVLMLTYLYAILKAFVIQF